MLRFWSWMMYFYPRPPRGGRQGRQEHDRFRKIISIHALREEGDCEQIFTVDKLRLFLSTPSARRATLPQGLNAFRGNNFYPRPPRGGRQYRRAGSSKGKEFLSTPSARRATDNSLILHPCHKFLSTPSARRATAKTETKSLFSNKLYNILHEFRRALIYNGSKSYPNHAK